MKRKRDTARLQEGFVFVQHLDPIMGNLKTGVQESRVLGQSHVGRKYLLGAVVFGRTSAPNSSHSWPKLGSLLFSYLALETALSGQARSLATDPGLDERPDRFNQPGRIDWLVQMDLESCLPRF